MNAENLRVGYGYDIHRLVSGPPLILGGVRFDHPLGLEGHSDADVVLHAIIDALLGAAGQGDIGHHFPNTSKVWQGASSLDLLDRVAKLLGEQGCSVINVDATIVAEEPKVQPRIPEMRDVIGKCLGIHPDRINVKATTAEGLGPEGRREGISARAVALVSIRH